MAPNSLGNLKVHCDGYGKGCRRLPCKKRQEAIDSGMTLPPSLLEIKAASAAAVQKKLPDFFERKLPFKNNVLNQMLAVWIVAEALPWRQIEDSILRSAFQYARRDAKISGQTWVAREAAGMCLLLQNTVLKEIKVSHSLFYISIHQLKLIKFDHCSMKEQHRTVHFDTWWLDNPQ